MNYKKLGKSGVEVSELILGCWAMGGDYFGATEDESSLEALRVSYENGVNTFDTAEIYGSGRSERVVGEAARRIGRDKVKIMVGGAPVTEAFCEQIGADCYTADAASAADAAVELCK